MVWASLLAIGGMAHAGPATVTMAADPTCAGTLPLTLTGGVPVTSVDVGGVPLTLLVDTGGFDTVSLGAAALDQAKPVFTGKTRKLAVGRGDKLEARAYRLPRVALGPHVLTDVLGSEYVFPADLPPAVPAGYVGLGLLRHFYVMVDYGHAKLSLVDRRCPVPDLPDGASWHRVRMESDADGPRISATMDGHKRSLLLDTGASYSTIRPGAAPQERRRHARGWELFTPSRLIAGDGEIEALELAVIMLPGPGTDGILGCNFFAEHQVVLDFRAREIAYRRVASPEPHPCPPPAGD